MRLKIGFVAFLIWWLIMLGSAFATVSSWLA